LTKICSIFPNTGKEGFLHSNPKGSKPFELHIDHYGPVDSGRSKKHIFVFVDGFTKSVRLYTTKTTNTREVIIALRIILEHTASASALFQIEEAVFHGA